MLSRRERLSGFCPAPSRTVSTSTWRPGPSAARPRASLPAVSGARCLGFRRRASLAAAALRRSGRRKGAGVRAQHLQEGGGAPRRTQRGCDRLFGSAAVDVQIEEVFPWWVATGPRLQLGELDAVLLEALEQTKERPGLVVDGANDRGLLSVARPLDRGRLGPPWSPAWDQKEASDVLLHRLDALGQDLQAVKLGRSPPGNGRLIVTALLLDQLGRACGVVCGDRFQVFADDEGLTLRQCLRM